MKIFPSPANSAMAVMSTDSCCGKASVWFLWLYVDLHRHQFHTNNSCHCRAVWHLPESCKDCCHSKYHCWL